MWFYTLQPTVLNMCLTGGIVIILVLLARLSLRKAPNIFSYAIWAVVACIALSVCLIANPPTNSSKNPDHERYDLSTQYCTAIENTTLYSYTDSTQDIRSPEQAAYQLAKLFMDDLCTESKSRTFRITEYRNLSVTVIPTSDLDDETIAIYNINENEIDNAQWLIEIEVEYQYEGTMSPKGADDDQWNDVLYQGSRVGFFMSKADNIYAFQSRYK